ncbi:MAG TPA: hypothetical protein VGI14_10720 [Casimicrobiaceae bacterium]
MAAFETWRRWAGALSDGEFACAWAALGIAAATPMQSAALAAGGGLRRVDLAHPRAGDHEAIACAAIVHGTPGKDGRLQTTDWAFPAVGAFVDREQTLKLDAIPAATWAAAWRDANVRQALGGPPGRLRITQAPQDASPWPWFAPLTRAEVDATAVRMLTRAASRVALQWPLRLGCLPSNRAQAILESVRTQWPSNSLSRLVVLDRRSPACDVLLHVGSAESLRTALDEHPAPCKAALVVLCGLDVDGREVAAVSDLQSRCDAHGLVALRSSTSDEALVRALNGFVEQVSHNEWLDMAATYAFARYAWQDALVWLSDALAATRLERMVERMKARILASPSGTRFGPLAGAGAVATRTWRGPAPAAAPIDEARVVASQLDALSFDHESDGASRAAEAARALEAAIEPEESMRRRADRFLQQQSFVGDTGSEQPADHGFVAGRPAHVCMRIGPRESAWQGLRQALAVETLPQDEDAWTLTLALTEPTYLPRGLTVTVELPHDGPSDVADFRFTPAREGRFEGLVTVMYRGRLLQYAQLSARVVSAAAPHAADAAPVLSDVVPVRSAIGDLDGRQQFDRAVVIADAANGKPQAAVLSDSSSQALDIARSVEVARDINTALSGIAQSAADYAEGFAGEEGRKLLVTLAAIGSVLHDQLVKDQLEAPGSRTPIARCEYIQVVSGSNDVVVPFEFIYDRASPDDDAKLCPRWREGVQAGRCPETCRLDDPALVCPAGFWGLQKVIERHQTRGGDRNAATLQSDPGRATSELRIAGASLLASSERVKVEDLVPLQGALARQTGVAAVTASTWKEWAARVVENGPTMIVALPHADGTGANISLEISGDSLQARQLTPGHVRARPDAPPPLVVLLGCDIAGTGGDYGSYVLSFRTRGAAVVIATIATVIGAHAARTASLLADTLLPSAGAGPTSLGEAMRAVKRQALLDGLIMPLCLVAYGDADWTLAR